MLFFWGEGKPEYPEKNLSVQSREPINSPTYDAESGNRTRATLVETIVLATAPSLHPENKGTI